LLSFWPITWQQQRNNMKVKDIKTKDTYFTSFIIIRHLHTV